MKVYETLLVDLDNTLWDTIKNNKESLEEIYNAYHWGRHYGSFETFYSVYQPNNDALWSAYGRGEIDKPTLILERFAKVLRPMGITNKYDILAINQEFLRRTADKTTVVEGAIEVMSYLKSKYKILILSNGFREVQHRKLSKSGLLPYVDHVVLSEDAGVNKPSKEIFDFAFRRYDLQAEDCLMIGDSWESDITGASNAGVDAYWFNPSKEEMPKEREDFHLPIREIHRLYELKDIL